LDRLTLFRCTVQTAVSEAVSVFHAEKLGVAADSFPVIYNGIAAPASPSEEEKRALRVEWGMTECRRIIGSVGRLDFQKGYDLLLDTLEALDIRIPQGERWGLVLIGDGPERKRLEHHAEKLNLKNIVVRFAGFRSDADRAMGAFDLFVMPSRYEGFGLTLLEAMSHGLPVVSSDADSLPELIADYAQGKTIRFLPGTEKETAQEIFNMAIQNTKRVESPYLSDEPMHHFSAERMVAEYLDLYRSIRKTTGAK
jgi:glycosyltransferase involved in cell wall biosynthesis